MGVDHKYYYNFEEEIKLSSFVTLKSEGNTLKLKTTVNTACGDYVFLAPLDPDHFPTLTLLTVNGKKISVTKRDAFYVDHEYPRFGKEIALLDGENEIMFEQYIKKISSFLDNEETNLEITDEDVSFAYVYKNGIKIIYWNNEEYVFVLKIPKDISKDECIKYINSLTIK